MRSVGIVYRKEINNESNYRSVQIHFRKLIRSASIIEASIKALWHNAEIIIINSILLGSSRKILYYKGSIESKKLTKKKLLTHDEIVALKRPSTGPIM